MKPILNITIILVILGFSANCILYGQQFEIIPFGGYQAAGKLKVEQGELNFKNGATYGLELNIWVENDMMAAFWYSRNDSELKLKENETLESIKLFDMGIEYFHAGAIFHPDKGKIRPFATITLGATRLSPQVDELEDNWEFSFAIGGGAKFFISDNIGFKVQGRFLLPVYISDASLYCTNGNCFISINAGTVQFQADFTTGLVVAL